MMRHFYVLLLCVLASTSIFAASYGTLVPEKSSLGFVSKQMGVPVSGRFQRFQAELNFDPAHPEVARGRVEVKLASIDAGSAEANDEVKGKDWFFIRNFPVARFEIRKVKPLGNGRFEVRGLLTIKNVSRDIVTVASFRQEGGMGLFEGGFVLKRLDFGIGEGLWGDPDTVSNEVQIKFVLAAQPMSHASSEIPKKK